MNPLRRYHLTVRSDWCTADGAVPVTTFVVHLGLRVRAAILVISDRALKFTDLDRDFLSLLLQPLNLDLDFLDVLGDSCGIEFLRFLWFVHCYLQNYITIKGWICK